MGALLSLSGGLQDAYTYNMRNGVFANAQTGNVVLMSQNFMSGEWSKGLHYLFPLLAFAAGIILAERIENRHKDAKKIHWKQIVLIVESVMLTIVGLLPDSYNMIANMMVSFACAMQVQTFKTVHGYGYASTMCIGNLRGANESLSKYIRTKEKAALYKSLYLFGIILMFAIGAGIGGVLSGKLGHATIWISPAILLTVTAMMMGE